MVHVSLLVWYYSWVHSIPGQYLWTCQFRVLFVKIAVQATVRAVIIKGYIVFLANISIPGYIIWYKVTQG